MTDNQPSKRQLQIAEEIRRLLAVELNDLTEIFVNGDFLTIMKATISKDLRYCKVFFRCKIENRAFFQAKLDSITNAVENLIYKKLQMRVRPEVHFVFDDTIIEREEILKIVEKNKGFL